MLALLQFDAAALPVLERLLAEGRLPALAHLKRSGTWIPLDAAATVLQSATYPTLSTGLQVSEHGLYSAFPWSAAEQRVRFLHDLPKPPTIWERLTASGRRALVVDPILGWTPRRMAGIYINGWNCEDRMLTQGRSFPRGIRRALARRHGRPPKLDDVYGRRIESSLLEWRRHLLEAPQRTASLAEDLLAREPFDLVWINFSSAHKAGHQLWDPASVVRTPLTPDADRHLRDGLAEVYVAVDAAVARVIEALPPRADVILFSPTGMGPNTSRADLLPDMVRHVLHGDGRRPASPPDFRAPVWALRSLVGARWRSAVARLLPDSLVADLTTRLYLRADWRRTKAMAIPGENKGYVRLNRRGRERDGIVGEAEAEEILAKLVEGLPTFHDPDGSPAITRVARISELTSGGAALDRLPDLVVYWSDRPAAQTLAVKSSRYGEIPRRGVGSGRSGNHTDDAWAIVLNGGSRPRELARTARVTDIGATACRLLEADTTGLDGQSLLEAS